MTRIIIRGIKEREEYINYLKENLPEAEWCFDKIHNATDTFLRALKMARDDACIHMEDDALLTNDFKNKVEAEIKKHPDCIIQFFSRRKQDAVKGSRWADFPLACNICHYFPKGYSALVYNFGLTWKGWEKDPTGYDYMLVDFLKTRKENYWLVIPSLVNHRIGDSMISKRRAHKRVSNTFIQ